MILQRFIWLYLWVAPHVLLGLVAAVMYRNRRYKDYPIFFIYLLFEVLQFAVLFSLSQSESVPGSLYRQIDLLGRSGSIALRFAIIQEMLEAPVAHCAALRRTTTWMLRGATAFLALLSAVFIGSVYSWSVREMIFPAYAIHQTFNIVQCGLLALVFLWHRFLGLKMENFVIAIALGMGLIAGLEPLLHALKDSASDSRIADLLQMGTYHVSVTVWLYFAIAQESFTSIFKIASLPDARKWAIEMGKLTWL
jgi:hypothetical protein